MKKVFIMVSLLLCITILTAGCGKSPKVTESDNSSTVADDSSDTGADTQADTQSDTQSDTGEAQSDIKDGKFNSIGELSDYWNNIYTVNEEVLNAYEGMPIMELVTPGLCFVTGVQYDMLNYNNEDGHFEGNLMLAGYPGYEDRKGSQITFGYEDTIKEASSWGNMLVGDKLAESGSCDLDKGYYFTENYTDRAGVLIKRSANEFQLQSDHSMCVLVIEGSTLDYSNEEKLTTSYIFIRGGEGQYDFAVGTSALGTDFDVLKLKEGMTKDMAIDMFKNAGAAIECSGGIKDGKFYVD